MSSRDVQRCWWVVWAGVRQKESCKTRIGRLCANKTRCWWWSCSEMQWLSVVWRFASFKSAAVVQWVDCPCHPQSWKWEEMKLLLCLIGKPCNSSHWMSMDSFTLIRSRRMSRITCSSLFGMVSHHVHIDSYDRNIPIGDQQPQRALIHTFHSSCSARG